jgi:hypothetical protein
VTKIAQWCFAAAAGLGAVGRVRAAAGAGVPEAGKLTCLYEAADRPGRGSQAAAFFDRRSPSYIGDLPNVARKVVGHSYFTTHYAGTLVSVRSALRERLRSIDPGLELWVSEYCVLENNAEIRGRGRDLGMRTALYVARVIHADLTVAEASAWHWWLAVSPYDYKDGLVYIDDSKTDGAIRVSKLLWALGHYSRFVRPGMRRLDVERSDGLSSAQAIEGVLVSAYRDPATARTAVVAVNQGDAAAPLRVRGAGVVRYRAYLTSAAPGDDLCFLGEHDAARDLALPPRSLVTLVSK